MGNIALKPTGMPKAVTYGLIIGWILVIAKCLYVPTLIARWQIPVHPSWVIVPTLIFAALVTVLAWTHDWIHDEG